MRKTIPRRIVFRGAGYELYVPPVVLNAPRVRDAATLSDRENETLDWLVQMEAESLGVGNWKDAVANDSVRAEYIRFRTAVEQALEEYPPLKGWLAEGYDISNLTDEEGVYAVLMTLRGEGVGIWDGRWDHFFQDPDRIEDVSKMLKSRLNSFADDTGGGSLSETFMEAAEEAKGS